MKKYNILLLLLLFTLLCVCISFNYLINPYGIFSHSINNDDKITLKVLERYWKPTALKAIKPNALLLGSSRTRDGFNIDMPYFSKSKLNWFNCAVNGGNTIEMYYFYNSATSHNKIEKVLFGLDFFMFNAFHKGRKDLPKYLFYKDQKRINALPSAKTIKEFISAILSTKSLKDSFTSLFPNKTCSNEQKQNQYTGFVTREFKNVHEKLAFDSMENAFLKEFWFPAPENKYQFCDYNGLNPLNNFRNILTNAHKNSIKIVLFISPSHARLWECIYQVGLWQKWEEWKRSIVRINEEVAMDHNKDPFLLIDFSGFHDFSTEQIPRSEEVLFRDMEYYSDTSHFRFKLGKKILTNIHNLELNIPHNKNFAVKLSSDNIEKHLEKIRYGRLLYSKEFPEYTLDIAKKVTLTGIYRN